MDSRAIVLLTVTTLIKFNQPQWQEPNHSYWENSPLIANLETTLQNFKESFSARASSCLSVCLSIFSFLPFFLFVSKGIKKSSHPQTPHAPKTITWVCFFWHFPFLFKTKTNRNKKQIQSAIGVNYSTLFSKSAGISPSQQVEHCHRQTAVMELSPLNGNTENDVSQRCVSVGLTLTETWREDSKADRAPRNSSS